MIKEDGLLAAFFTEPSFEEWRKHASISIEEESVSRRVDRVEEMSIPTDLEDKLGYVLIVDIICRFVYLSIFFFQNCEEEDWDADRAVAEDLYFDGTARQKT